MKELLKVVLLLTILIPNLNTYGQQWGVKANGGLSRITISPDLVNPPFSTPFVASGEAGLYYHLFMGNHFSLGAELLFSQIEGKDRMDQDLHNWDGTIVGYATNIGYRHISYISLPVYYGYTIKRFTLHAGFQISYALSSSGRERGYGHFNEQGQEETYSGSSKTDNINIKKLDYGPRVGVIYQLTNKLAAEATYFYGMDNIQKGDPPFWELKVQQITLGIRYTFWSALENK